MKENKDEMEKLEGQCMMVHWREVERVGADCWRVAVVVLEYDGRQCC